LQEVNIERYVIVMISQCASANLAFNVYVG